MKYKDTNNPKQFIKSEDEKQEFVYPMWFKSKETGDIVEFSNLSEGKCVFMNEKYSHWQKPPLYKEGDDWVEHTRKDIWEQVENPNEHLDNEVKEGSHNSHYKKQAIDTIARCKANMTLEQQKAICIFQIDRYVHREKGQNLADIKKTRDYLDWLEEIEIEIELENER